MDAPVVSESTGALKKSENLGKELKPMNDFEETPTSEEVPSDVETGSVSGYFNFMEAHTSQKFPSISSDDGTETYHSLEGEPIINDHDQDEEPYEKPSDVIASSNTAEVLVEEDSQRDEERDPKKIDAEVTTTADNGYLVDSGNDDGNEHETRILISEEIVRIHPRSLAELPWPLETVEEEITSFIADNSDDDNLVQLPENAALTDSHEEPIPDEKTIIERPDGFEPPVSSASTTPDSMNTVEAVMTAEAHRNYVTVNVDVVDGPGLSTSQSESNEGPKSLGNFDGGPRTYSNEELKILDGHELLTSHSESLAGLMSSAKFEGAAGTVSKEELKLNAIDTETGEHGKTIFAPGLAIPQSVHDELIITTLEMSLNSIKHFQGLQPRMTHSDEVVETSFQESSVPSGSSVMYMDADGTYKTYATREDMLEDMEKRTGYGRNDPEKRSNGISGPRDIFIERIRKAMDEMKRDGIYNPCFLGDNAHSITTCEANECQGISGEPSNENDLENTRSFHDLVDQLRDKSGDSNPELEEVAVISPFEPEQENVQDLKTTKVAFGRADEEPYSAELGGNGKAYEQPRRSYCGVCCLKVKKRVLSADVIFLLFILMFLVFCVIMRLVFDGAAHGGRPHGITPAPTIQ